MVSETALTPSLRDTPLPQAGERTMSAEPLLKVEGLTTEIQARKRTLRAVENVSFSVKRGEILGVVGESGCGKSMTALSIMRLLPLAARVSEGTIEFDGQDLLKLSGREMRRGGGQMILMGFLEAMTGRDPACTIGREIIGGSQSPDYGT